MGRLLLSTHGRYALGTYRVEVSEYFPLQHTVHVMLDTMGDLFGLVFAKSHRDCSVHQQDIVWHGNVQLFSVWNAEDEGGAFVGYLCLDLFTRDFKPTVSYLSGYRPSVVLSPLLGFELDINLGICPPRWL